MFRVALFIFFAIQTQHDVTARSFQSQLIPIEYKIICKGGIFEPNIQINGKKIKCNSTITDADAMEFKRIEQYYNKTMANAKETLHKANETLFNSKLQLGNLAVDLQGMLEKWRLPPLPSFFPISRKNAVNLDGEVLLNSNGDLVKLRRPVGNKRELEVRQEGEGDSEVRYIRISNPEALKKYRQKYADNEIEESEESRSLRCGCNKGKQSLKSLLESLRSSLTGDEGPPIGRCNCGSPLSSALRNRRKDGPLPSRSDQFSGEKLDNKMDIDFINTKAKEKKMSDIGDWEGTALEKNPKKPKRLDNWDSKPKGKWEPPRPKRGEWGANNNDDHNSHTIRWRPKNYGSNSYQPKKKLSKSNGGGDSGWGQYKNLRIEPRLVDEYSPPERNRNRHLENNVRSNYNEFGRTPIPYIGKKRIYDVADE